jgi:hypothetical protein
VGLVLLVAGECAVGVGGWWCHASAGGAFPGCESADDTVGECGLVVFHGLVFGVQTLGLDGAGCADVECCGFCGGGSAGVVALGCVERHREDRLVW